MARVKYYNQASQEWKYADAALNMKGKDGLTPQKGIDYFTERDVEELTEQVLNQGVLTYNKQYLTDEQKTQARENIGADKKKDNIPSVAGKIITLDDSTKAPLQGLKLYGKTTQNGTPTPEAPVPLESAGADGSVDVTVCGKNLFDVDNRYKFERCTVEDNIISINVDNTTGSSTLYANFITRASRALKEGTKYLIALELLETNGSVTFRVVSTNSGKTDDSQFKSVKDIATTAVGKYFAVVETKDSFEGCGTMCRGFASVKTGMSVKCKFRISILEDITVNESNFVYEPYKEQTLPVSTPNGLPGIPVDSGGNYTDSNGKNWICDEIDFARGKYIKRVNHLHITTHDGVHSLGTYVRCQLSVPYGNNSYSSKAMNTLFPYSGDYTGEFEHAYVWSNLIYWFLPIKTAQTQAEREAEVAAWLSNHDFQFMYVLKTPIETDLTAEELVQYAELHTNYPHTTIFNDSNATMQLTYATPTSLLPISGGSVDRLEVPTPTKPNEAATKDYVDKHINTVRDIISNFHSNIENEVEGEVIVVSDSAKAPIPGLKVFGKTEQKTTAGKNLLQITETTSTNVGVTFTVNNDGSITASGTAGSTADALKYIGSVTLAPGTYICSGALSDNIKLRVGKQTGNTVADSSLIGHATNTALQFTLAETATIVVSTRVTAGTAVSNAVFWPMIRLASITDSTYEPYTGGKPSPNPEYPQELKSVGDVTVTICGKNLFATAMPVAVGMDGVETNLANARSTPYIPVKPGTKMAFSKSAALTVSNSNGMLHCFDENKKIIQSISVLSYNALSGVRVIPEGVAYVRFCQYGFTEFEGLKIQIEYGDTVTDYDDTEAKTLPISTPNGLPGIPVDSGGNYTDDSGQQWVCDEVDFEKGVYVKRIRTQAIDMKSANIVYTSAASDNNSYYYNLINAIDNGYAALEKYAMCDVLPCNTKGYSDRTKEAILVGGRYVSVRINANRVADTSADSLRAVFPEILKVQYALATPVETALSAEQLSAFAELHTNYPNTTIYNDSNAHMNVRYIQDTKMYVDKKFAELAEIILNKF